MSHLYGVFPTHGYSNDTKYPDTYTVGEVVLDNAGCSLTNKVGHNKGGLKRKKIQKCYFVFSSYLLFNALDLKMLVYAHNIPLIICNRPRNLEYPTHVKKIRGEK